MDPYQLLNITPLASRNEVEAAYAEMCEKYPQVTHPDEHALVEDAYKTIITALKKTESAKIPARTPDTTPAPLETAAVPVPEEKTADSPAQGKKKQASLIIGGILAGVLLSGGVFAMMSDNNEEESYDNVSLSAEEESSEEDVTADTSEADAAAEEAEAAALAEEEERLRLEESVDTFNDLMPIFFEGLENSLENRDTSYMEASTAKLRNEFQPSLDDMESGGYIFDGEVEPRSITSEDIELAEDGKIVAQVTTDYTSRSYNPYLHERPPGNDIIWKMTLIEQGGEWIVDERELVSDSASEKKMAIDGKVKDDIIKTVHWNALEWVEAYSAQDTSYFSFNRSPEYLARQQSYYDILEEKDIYWSGQLDHMKFSFDSIEIGEGAKITATIEAMSFYNGSYYNVEDDSLYEMDNSKGSVFRYTLEYDQQEKGWFIIGTKQLKNFTKENLKTYDGESFGSEEEY